MSLLNINVEPVEKPIPGKSIRVYFTNKRNEIIQGWFGIRSDEMFYIHVDCSLKSPYLVEGSSFDECLTRIREEID